MRQAFVTTLCDLAAQDDRIILMTGDLGFQALEPFRERFPRRFFNMGVAEQNMIGVASGLAESGFRPYAYSIAPFVSLRALEFIRNGPVAHGWPVRIVGMGMGFDYGHAGPSHYALEDIGVTRTLPGLMIVIPADSARAARALRDTADHAGPIYYSLSKQDGVRIDGVDEPFQPGRLTVLRRGVDLAIVAMGSMAPVALAAAETLTLAGHSVALALVSSFNPDPVRDTAEFLADVPCVLSVEAQTLSGGLGAFVAGVIASTGLRCRLRMLGIRESPDGRIGTTADRLRHCELDETGIVRHVQALLDDIAR